MTKILTIDVGTGTQDIYLYNSRVDMENGFKMVIPSPTMMVFREITRATQRGEAVALSGVTMGGGPSHWAARDHAQAGYPLYATPDAARTFDDDLEVVKESGITILSEDELSRLPDSVRRFQLRDFDFGAVARAFAQFGVSLGDLDAAAVAVFDHGAAPPGYSDRQFRFDYLAERLGEGAVDGQLSPLSQLAFRRGEIPREMTRLAAVEQSAGDVDSPLVVMDTAPAAVLGALQDAAVRAPSRVLIANVGNFHTLAFRMGDDQIEGVFEHHTGLLDVEKLDQLLISLAQGTLTHEQVFEDHGHGALLYHPQPYPLGKGDFDLAVTGPRRMMMEGSRLRTYYPAPFGDMMLVGCFGLLAAVGDVLPRLRDEVHGSLREGRGSGTPPWEV
ncbi:MAG: DUF1786 domain-containing protein [Anaerolineales bacterium]|nr:DUF1786 domain-containing protein [Anaerolineales bacterium]